MCRTYGVSAALVAVVLLSVTAPAQVVINEVLYDPEGSDTGLEFVELLNCGRHGVSLTGWVLETGNGAHTNDWTVEWIGGDLDYIEPGRMFLVGEVDVLPEPDYATPLDLQNGPDGVRLSDGGGPVDVVGWGEPLFQEYYEGAPAVDVPSGRSLARSPDCFDHDDNSLDFVAALPTPGAPNSHSDDLCLRVRHPGVVMERGEPAELACIVTNIGAQPAAAYEASVELFADGLAAPVCSSTLAGDLAPRDSVEVVLRWTHPGDGYHRCVASLMYGLDCEPSNNTAATSLTVGTVGGIIAVNELMHSPVEGATEWVELFNFSADSVDLDGWSLGDDVYAHRIDTDMGSLQVLQAGAYLLVARDGELMEGLASCPVVEADGWEALSADDTVTLLDEFGTPMDRLTYERDWGGDRGVSLERVRPDMPAQDAGNWGGSVAPEGSTPGRTNSIHLGAVPAAGRLTVTPNPFTPNGDGDEDRALLRVELPVARATVRMTVFDLEGRVRAVLADHEAVSSESELLWDGAGVDGAPLPSGLYIVYLEAIDARAGVFVTAKTAVGIVR